MTFNLLYIQDSVRPEDKGRRFILCYRLADDMMTIYEPPVRNSGIIGGKFLERTRVAKPNCPPDQPSFYGPQDFYIGAIIEVFRHRFCITNADEYVLNFMEEQRGQFSGMDTVKSCFNRTGHLLAYTSLEVFEEKMSWSWHPLCLF